MELCSRRAGLWRDAAGKDRVILQAGMMELCCSQGEGLMLQARELGGMLQAGRTEGSCRQDGRATLQVAGMEPCSRRAGWWRDTAGKDGAMLQAGGMG